MNFTVTLYTSLQNKITSHKSRQFTPHHYTSHHFTYLHSIPTSIPLPVTTFLTLLLNVFSLQGKDVSKPAGNWFQLLMVLFTKEYYLGLLKIVLLIDWLISIWFRGLSAPMHLSLELNGPFVPHKIVPCIIFWHQNEWYLNVPLQATEQIRGSRSIHRLANIGT